jgi:toxin ParE1/3/4
VAKPVRLRRLAADDIDAALDFYVTSAGAGVARRFLDAVQRGLSQLSRHPQVGSLRFAFELDIPELRAWPIAKFPYLVFYVERDAEIDVWRLVHTSRDIPATLADSNNPDAGH